MNEHIRYLQTCVDVCHKEGLMLAEEKIIIATRKIELLCVEIEKTRSLCRPYHSKGT